MQCWSSYALMWVCVGMYVCVHVCVCLCLSGCVWVRVGMQAFVSNSNYFLLYAFVLFDTVLVV